MLRDYLFLNSFVSNTSELSEMEHLGTIGFSLGSWRAAKSGNKNTSMQPKRSHDDSALYHRSAANSSSLGLPEGIRGSFQDPNLAINKYRITSNLVIECSPRTGVRAKSDALGCPARASFHFRELKERQKMGFELKMDAIVFP